MYNKKENISEVTEEQVEAWKKLHGTVFKIEVATEPEKFEALTVSTDLDDLPKLTAYLKKPDRKIMNFALVTMPKNIISAGLAVLKDCWLGGDDLIISNEDYAASASMQAIELVDIYQSRLKKV